MTNPAWKRTERAIAARLGGQRVPVSGRQRGDAPDIAHDRLAIEVKHRRSVPAWLLDAMRQATGRGRHLPVAIVHQHGGKHADDLGVNVMRILRTVSRARRVSGPGSGSAASARLGLMATGAPTPNSSIAAPPNTASETGS